MKTICIVVGTRPEAIKMAPVILAIRQQTLNHENIRAIVCSTAQHREMLDEVFRVFGIVADFDLDVMQPGQDLTDVTCRVLTGLRDVFKDVTPSYVVVHGDTATTMAASLAAYYQRVPVAHVEAGLRTGDRYAPWPEEINRRLTGAIATIHFAPTQQAHGNLLREGVESTSIHVTGNTAVDAIELIKKRLETDAELAALVEAKFSFLHSNKRLVLVTGHRRENFGNGIASVCRALRSLGSRSDIEIVYAVHPNPSVRGPVAEALDKCPSIHLIDPPDYLGFVSLMKRAYLILSDSGGIQEEAPSLGRPVLVTRTVTERPEGVEAGVVKLVGTDESRIVEEVEALLDDANQYSHMVKATNPFGDGRSATRIAEILTQGQASSSRAD